jgi:hypothetical protein
MAKSGAWQPVPPSHLINSPDFFGPRPSADSVRCCPAAPRMAVGQSPAIRFFRRQEVHDLIALARTITDSRDTLALGALMRGPLVGLTEAELLDIADALPIAESARGIAPRAAHRSGLDTLASSGSCHRTKAAAFRRRFGFLPVDPVDPSSTAMACSLRSTGVTPLLR